MSDRMRASIEGWRKRLLDTTKRNALVNCRIGARGSLKIEHPAAGTFRRGLLDGAEFRFPWKRDLVPPAESDGRGAADGGGLLLFPDEASGAAGEPKVTLEECRRSRLLAGNDLLTDYSDRQLAARLARFSLNGRTALAEQGVNVLYVAFGLLTWYEAEHSETPLLAPLVLFPVRLEQPGPTAPWTMSLLEEEATPNHSLRERLRQDSGLELPEANAESLLEPEGITRYFDALRAAVARERRWTVEDAAVVGQFAFQKLAMYEDYGRNGDAIASHEHCRRIAGDSSAPAPPPLRLRASDRLDDVPPREVHPVLPYDASQLEAILAAKGGASLVLDGPPGTGKSQTIANLIAECLAGGKTVLFVSEKAAALEVVKRRLDEACLGDFVLDCHGHRGDVKKQVLLELGRCLRLDPEGYPDPTPDLERLERVRGSLNGFVRALHSPRSALGRSVFEVYGRLSSLAGSPVSRCEIPRPLEFDPAGVEEVRRRLVAMNDVRAAVEGHAGHPWRGCVADRFSLSLEDDVRHRFGELGAALRAVAGALRPLADAGLALDTASVGAIPAASAAVRGYLAGPLVPARWIAAGPARSAAAVRRAADLAARRGAALARAPEFAPAASTARADAAVFEGHLPKDGPWTRLVLPHSAGGVRSMRRHLGLIEAELEALATLADGAGRAAEEVIDGLGGRIQEPPVGRLADLAAAGAAAGRCRAFLVGWFDDARAAALRRLAADAEPRAAELSRRRSRLSTRFSPAAFTGDAAAVVREAVALAPSGRQLFPQWRSVRRGLARLTRSRPKAGDDLFRDLEDLARYHDDRERLSETFRAEAFAPEADALIAVAVAFGPALGRLTSRWRPIRQDLERLSGKPPRPDDAFFERLESLAACHAGRERLSDRYLPEAFAADALAAEAESFRPLWRRWLPRWRRVRPDLARLRRVPAAGTGALFADLAELRRHQQDRAALAADFAPAAFAADAAAAVAAAVAFRPVWEEIAPQWRALRGDLAPLCRAAPAADTAFFAALEELSRLHGERKRLSARFRPECFDPAAEVVVREAQGFGPHWSRLVPRWRAVRGEIERFLPWRSPVTPALLRDLDDLARYHADREKLAGALRPYEHDLLLHDGGDDLDVDWPATKTGLDAVDSLRRLVRGPVPGVFLAALTGPEADPVRLTDAAARLRDAAEGIERAVERLRPKFAVTRLAPDETRHTAATPTQFADWLRRAAAGLSETAAPLDAVAAFLLPDVDPPLDRLPGRVAALAEARRLGDALAEAVDEARDVFGEADAVNRDWAAEARAADYLAGVVDELRGPPPPAVARLLSDPGLRAAAAEALDAADARWATGVAPGLDFLGRLFPLDRPAAEDVVPAAATPADLAAWLERRVEALPRLREWLAFREAAGALGGLGLGTVVDELLAGRYTTEQAEAAFLARFYRLWLDSAADEDAVLREFRGDRHERQVEEFRQLDDRALAASPGRIRGPLLAAAGRPRAASLDAPAGSELSVLLREVNKSRRHMPLRQLFARVPTLLPRLKPCMMMSPLSVSTFLDSPSLRFDVVVFDEASQVLPWDAVGAIYRGRQLVVAGDQKQLPPSSFFSRLEADGDEEEEDETGVAGFESLLDVLCAVGMPRRRLRWHYRSRREPLIAFSNRHFYDGELVTFPSPSDLDGSAVRLDFVPDGRWRTGATFNPVEARRVAALVREHVERHPGKSLGVITFNQKQQLAVLDELTRVRRERPDLESLLSESRDAGEPLFVKNLENVQGDERDCIILSVAYAPDEATGRLSMSFGPLNSEGGERRLNVAVTRARERVTVVSSIRADDIDLGRTKAVGVRRLKEYLAFAEHGPAALASVPDAGDGVSESPFEEAVARRLESLGLDVRRQVGCGAFRIDLGITDPARPGRYLLGIECDGATYHSGRTARDRDRLRQDVLEGLGWRITRIWSTDWVRDPDREVEKVRAAVDAARRAAEADADAEASNPPAAPPRPVPAEAVPAGPASIRTAAGAGAGIGPGSRAATGSGRGTYQNIDEVPEFVIDEILLALVLRFGSTPAEELAKAAARELGFQRTGPKIKSRVDAVLARLLKKGRLRRDGNRVLPAS